MDRNVLGGELEPCGTDPLTGFYRDGCCSTGPEDIGSHTVCAVVTSEFLEHQRRIGNDLSTPMPQFRFPGLVPGDRWCVTAANWLRAYQDGLAAPVVLASTHERALEIVPLTALKQHSVDVPADASALEDRDRLAPADPSDPGARQVIAASSTRTAVRLTRAGWFPAGENALRRLVGATVRRGRPGGYAAARGFGR